MRRLAVLGLGVAIGVTLSITGLAALEEREQQQWQRRRCVTCGGSGQAFRIAVQPYGASLDAAGRFVADGWSWDTARRSAPGDVRPPEPCPRCMGTGRREALARRLQGETDGTKRSRTAKGAAHQRR